MNKVKLLTISVIGLLLLNFGILAKLIFQHPPHPPGGHERPEPKTIIIEKLKLDESQQKNYEVLIDAHRHGMDSLHEVEMNLRNELYSLLKSADTDTLLSGPILLKIAETHKQVELLNYEHFKKIRNLCRPEQEASFSALIGELTRLFGPPPPKR
jgi:periplasmic protein CpxP/Spy